MAVPTKDFPRSWHSNGSIEEYLRNKFLPSLFGGEDITADFRKILGHSVKHGSLVITDPRLSAECAYNNSKAASRELVESLLGGSVLNYIGHRACMRKASHSARLSKRISELSNIFKQQEQTGGHEKIHLHRAMRNGAWFSDVPHRLNGTELSREVFRDSLHLRYGLMPQDTPVTCDGCGKEFSIEHTLSCPKGGLVLARHEATRRSSDLTTSRL